MVGEGWVEVDEGIEGLMMMDKIKYFKKWFVESDFTDSTNRRSKTVFSIPAGNPGKWTATGCAVPYCFIKGLGVWCGGRSVPEDTEGQLKF